jgi:hypothetical protein
VRSTSPAPVKSCGSVQGRWSPGGGPSGRGTGPFISPPSDRNYWSDSSWIEPTFTVAGSYPAQVVRCGFAHAWEFPELLIQLRIVPKHIILAEREPPLAREIRRGARPLGDSVV